MWGSLPVIEEMSRKCWKNGKIETIYGTIYLKDYTEITKTSTNLLDATEVTIVAYFVFQLCWFDKSLLTCGKDFLCLYSKKS